MNNSEIIKALKTLANDFSKEEISDIIETVSKAYANNEPFLSEEEIAEQTLDGFIKQLSRSDRDSISKAKAKVFSLIN